MFFRKSLKFVFCLLVVLFTTLDSSVFASGSLPYSDISTYVDGFDAVVELKSEKVFTGYPDDTFKGDKTINRAELVKVAALANHSPSEIGAYIENLELKSFADVNYDSWYAAYLQFAQGKGWINGYEDGTFRPNDPVTVAEAVKIILESQIDVPEMVSGSRWWFENYLIYLIDRGIIVLRLDGQDYFAGQVDNSAPLENKFSGGWLGHPNDNISRTSVAELIWKISKVKNIDGDKVILDEYEPRMTVNDYSEKYDAKVTKNANNTFDIEDKTLGFSLKNLPLQNFDLEDVRFFLVPELGYKHGFITGLAVGYPSDVNDYLYETYYGYFSPFYLVVADRGYVDGKYDSFTEKKIFSSSRYDYFLSNCVPADRVPEDLKDLYDHMCKGDLAKNVEFSAF